MVQDGEHEDLLQQDLAKNFRAAKQTLNNYNQSAWRRSFSARFADGATTKKSDLNSQGQWLKTCVEQNCLSFGGFLDKM